MDLGNYQIGAGDTRRIPIHFDLPPGDSLTSVSATSSSLASTVTSAVINVVAHTVFIFVAFVFAASSFARVSRRMFFRSPNFV